MNRALTITQIISGVFLITAILIQARGKGFARSWGSSASFTRRGLEKVLFRATFFIAAIFIITSMLLIAI